MKQINTSVADWDISRSSCPLSFNSSMASKTSVCLYIQPNTFSVLSTSLRLTKLHSSYYCLENKNLRHLVSHHFYYAIYLYLRPLYLWIIQKIHHTFWFRINSCDAPKISLRIDIVLRLISGKEPFRTYLKWNRDNRKTIIIDKVTSIAIFRWQCKKKF